MSQIKISYYNCEVGKLILGSFEEKLCLVDFHDRQKRLQIDHRIKSILQSEYVESSSLIIEKTKEQLVEYFHGTRQQFDIPRLMLGTDFQKSVWSALEKVPYGTTATYLEIAQQIGNKKAVRAVANTNGANALGIIIPCHRVISSDGSLGGYAGGDSAKKRLLDIEGISLTEQFELQL